MPVNPYRSRNEYSFWKRAVSGVPAFDLDPVVDAPFILGSGEKVATAGSCFAQNIARALQDNAFNYYVAEQAPHHLSAADARAKNYGTYSARYGNVYTTRQLRQLFDRAFGRFEPEMPDWQRADGRFVDPFRPQVEPDGFAGRQEVRAAAEHHLGCVREMLQTLDVFVFTLGLTEGWVLRSNGAVLPIAPGVSGGTWDPDLYEFVNFNVGEVVADLAAALDILRSINPAAKIIITVSPVPLLATFRDQHVLVSNTYSKSVLRVAAEQVAAGLGDVMYFPSFEIITNPSTGSMYFEEDLRSVSQAGVQHVMRVFFKHLTDRASGPTAGENRFDISSEVRKVSTIVCDEEAIETSLEGVAGR